MMDSSSFKSPYIAITLMLSISLLHLDLQDNCGYADRIRNMSRGTSVMLSSPGVAPVCDGDQLELNCAITGTLVEWSIFRVPENETTAVRYVRRVYDNHPGQNSQPTTINSVVFNFTRISLEPLVSRLVISPAHTSINETKVVCQDLTTRNSSSTVVKIINNEIVGEPYVSNYLLLSEDRDGVTALLQWTINLLHYDIIVYPNTHCEVTASSITIKLLYRTSYNVSIVHKCSGENKIPTCIGIYYPNCYGDPIEESTTLIVNCSESQAFTTEESCPELVTRLNHSTTGIPTPSHATTTSTTVMLRTDLISVTCVLVMISVVTFIIGFICGHCFSPRWRKSADKNGGSPSDPTTERGDDLELKENVAYITIRPK